MIARSDSDRGTQTFCSPSKVTGLGAVTGPPFLAMGWLALELTTDEGPGFGWTPSHVLLLVGAAFVAPVLGLGHLRAVQEEGGA
jgi:hypothetical protein